MGRLGFFIKDFLSFSLKNHLRRANLLCYDNHCFRFIRERIDQLETTSKQARVQVERPMLAMIGVLVGAFVGMFSETSLNIALPQLIRALNISTASAQWLVTGYMLVIGIVLPFSSLLTKWFSTRQLVIFGLSDFLLGAIISALAALATLLLTFGENIDPSAKAATAFTTGVHYGIYFTIALIILGLIISLGLRKKEK